jgi:endonuclease/exonuclease/phosphatase family metal-dependent hydrolase
VFVSDDLDVLSVDVPWNGRSRRASDHLPLIVELEHVNADAKRASK